LKTEKETYKKLCAQRADLPVFLQHWWLDAVCKNWQVAIANKGDHITGVWPYAIEKKPGVSMLRTPKLTPYTGPYVLPPDDIKASNEDGFEHETITALAAQLPDVKVWNLSLLPGIRQAGLFKGKKLEVTVRQTFLIDLQKEESLLFSDMKESLRRNIRAAEKEITITDASEHLADLYRFQKHTLDNKNASQPYTLADMQQVMDASRQHNSCALWVAKKEGNVQAIVWNVWDSHTSYYYMGAQNPAADNYKAISALLWYAIKKAKERGNKVFDMEGSMDAGVERFFRGFAGERELYLVLKKNESLLWKIKEALIS
jgi:Acetyltransferase (GNAT) domain